MEIERAIRIIKCPKCGNEIIVNQVWYPGGCNDYGSFILECNNCKNVFDFYLGRDLDASSVVQGAILIDRKYK